MIQFWPNKVAFSDQHQQYHISKYSNNNNNNNNISVITDTIFTKLTKVGFWYQQQQKNDNHNKNNNSKTKTKNNNNNISYHRTD